MTKKTLLATRPKLSVASAELREAVKAWLNLCLAMLWVRAASQSK
jgi:hypothetical protein